MGNLHRIVWACGSGSSLASQLKTHFHLPANINTHLLSSSHTNTHLPHHNLLSVDYDIQSPQDVFQEFELFHLWVRLWIFRQRQLRGHRQRHKLSGR